MSNSDHVVMRTSSEGLDFACVHCSAKVSFRIPVSVGDFAALGEAFVQRHRACRPFSAPPTSTPEGLVHR